MKLLEAVHISKAFDRKAVLEDVTIRLEEGELVSILGLSGSGKTYRFMRPPPLRCPSGTPQ